MSRSRESSLGSVAMEEEEDDLYGDEPASKTSVPAAQNNGAAESSEEEDDDDDDVKPKAAAGDFYRADLDELDFEAKDEFQDDDENPNMEPDNDEDVKESRERVRREMLGANNFGTADEQALEAELRRELMEEEARKIHGKGIEKNLIKIDKNMLYKQDREDSDNLLSSVSSTA